MPMMRMLSRITSTITISHMTPLLRSEKEVEVRRDTGDISVMVDIECKNDRIDPWAEANISAFLTVRGIVRAGVVVGARSDVTKVRMQVTRVRREVPRMGLEIVRTMFKMLM